MGERKIDKARDLKESIVGVEGREVAEMKKRTGCNVIEWTSIQTCPDVFLESEITRPHAGTHGNGSLALKQARSPLSLLHLPVSSFSSHARLGTG